MFTKSTLQIMVDGSHHLNRLRSEVEFAVDQVVGFLSRDGHRLIHEARNHSPFLEIGPVEARWSFRLLRGLSGTMEVQCRNEDGVLFYWRDPLPAGGPTIMLSSGKLKLAHNAASLLLDEVMKKYPAAKTIWAYVLEAGR